MSRSQVHKSGSIQHREGSSRSVQSSGSEILRRACLSESDWVELLGTQWWYRALDLADRICGDGVYPARELVFRAFEEVSPKNVQVIIIAQDPYHSPGKARGVAFGYHPDYKGKPNSSLLNIMGEVYDWALANDINPDAHKFDTTLRHWTSQGVLLLNTRLTVVHERPMSHAGLGWEELMDEALAKIIKWGQPPILAWGAEARKMAEKTNAWNVVATSHPCRYSASRGNNPFLGSGCFGTVNAKLIEQGDQPINWIGG